MLFFAEYCEPKLSKPANRLASLFTAFIRFHIFLQTWGLTKSLEKDQEYVYEFEKALESEKDLDMEVDQLNEAIDR